MCVHLTVLCAHTHTEGRDGEAGTEIATILRLDTPTTHHMTTVGERRGEGEEEEEEEAEEEEEEGGEVEAGIRRNLMKEDTRVTRAEEGVVAAGMGRGGDGVAGGGGGDVEGSHKEDRTEVCPCVCVRRVFMSTPLLSASTGGAYPYQQQPQMQYFNGPLSAGAPGGMFFPQYTSPVFYNAPIVPVDKGTLHDYIRKQM